MQSLSPALVRAAGSGQSLCTHVAPPSKASCRIPSMFQDFRAVRLQAAPLRDWQFVVFNRFSEFQKITSYLSDSEHENLSKRSEYYLSSVLHNLKSRNKSTFLYKWQNRQLNGTLWFYCDLIPFEVIIFSKSFAVLSVAI